MKPICSAVLLVLLPLVLGGHGHAHDHGHGHGHEEAPSFKWSKAANTPDEDLTLDEEGIDEDNIETITGHGHAHVQHHGHAHDQHHGHAHGGHGHSHGHHHGHSHGQQREPTAEERAKHRAKLHANWDDDDEEVNSRSSIWFNAMMATLLISAAPFFILFLIPLDKSAESQWLLKIMLAFASGGLLGDALLHLIPHAMMAAEDGGDGHGHSHSHGHSHGDGGDHDPHDMSVGLGVLGGIMAFLCVEKFVRIVRGGHGHSHDIKPVEKTDKKETVTKVKKKAKSSDNEEEKSDDDAKKGDSKSAEKKKEKVVEKKEEPKEEEEGEIQIAGYLNLFADCFHNFTDGLAIGASFLAGDSIGMITTLSILFHEIPHEIGDFAILIQSGVPRGKAIALQLLTAVGAITGCAVSLILGGATDAASKIALPFTAGGFIYIATVHVIPELLEGASFKQSVLEIMAMLVGVGMMIIIAQYE